MIKVITMLKRKEGMSLDLFRSWMTKDHPKFSLKVPGVRRYIVNVAVQDSPDLQFDAVVELWFDSEETFKSAYGTAQGKAAVDDALAHVSGRARMIVGETVLIP